MRHCRQCECELPEDSQHNRLYCQPCKEQVVAARSHAHRKSYRSVRYRLVADPIGRLMAELSE